MAQDVYRKTALERLSTPEQLDQLIDVTTPRSWLTLAALLLLILALGVWGVVGRVTTRVQAQGMLIGGGVSDVVPLSAGAVSRLAVRVGDQLEAGDVVAELAQPELERQLGDTRSRIAELQVEYRQLESFGSQDLRLQAGFLDQQRQSLERQIRAGEERLEYLERQAVSEEGLLAVGLITSRQLQATRQSILGGREENERGRAELTQLTSRELTVQFDRQQQLEIVEQRIREAERLLAQLDDQLVNRSRVTAAVSGRVLEVMVDVGGLVTPGLPIAKLGRADGASESLQAILYVSIGDGKKISEGMEVRVSPATVKPEEHGFIIARVVRVADFPSTSQGMMHVLKNDRLVAQLAAGGAPFEVVAALDTDPSRPSGFRWTSRAGPDLPVRGGTPASAWIQVDAQRPVALLIPALRRLFTATPPTLPTGGPN
jgi:NHLM bacteriocin system secretion protein